MFCQNTFSYFSAKKTISLKCKLRLFVLKQQNFRCLFFLGKRPWLFPLTTVVYLVFDVAVWFHFSRLLSVRGVSNQWFFR